MLHKYRILSTSSLERLVFNSTTARRRIKKLVDNNYLGAKSLTDNDTGLKRDNVYFLKESAYEFLPFEYRRQSIPKSMFLAHTSHVNSVRISIESAIQKHSHLSLRSFLTERDTDRLSNGNIIKVIYDKYFSPRLNHYISIRPDSVFVIELPESKKSVVYFVEVDEATEKHSVIRNKIKFYWDYFHHSENGHKRYMKRNSVNVDFFRVLFITVSDRRIKHLVNSLTLEEGMNIMFFSTFDLIFNSVDLTEAIFHFPPKGNTSLIKPR